MEAPTLSWRTRLGRWGLSGFLLLAGVRVFCATVVQVEGQAMAPNLGDADRIVVARGDWLIAPGDAVVYHPPPSFWQNGEGQAPPNGRAPLQQAPLAVSLSTGKTLPSAWLDAEVLATRWQSLNNDSRAVDSAQWWIGRVLARPGDVVVFGDPAAKQGIIVNGVVIHDVADPQAGTPTKPTRKVVMGERVVAVQGSALRLDLARLLPPNTTLPVAVSAPGYLLLADDRDRGACCDSRRLGWIARSAVEGSVVARVRASALWSQGSAWTWQP